MWGGRVVVGIAVASLVSGCAGTQARQQLARLQSQVGLLDERITQLERSGVSSGGAPLSAEPMMDVGAASGTSARPQQSASVAHQETAGQSAKPSTREIQRALKNAGFYQGAVDGKMGKATREAVREFQRVHGLKDDGVVDKRTWAKLQPYVDLSSAAGKEAATVEPLK